MMAANPNKLIHESSPYLLQHAHNPVDWYPWGDEALNKAKEEDKPILVSIGYSACHWCHVMEKECFEKQEIASIMNAFFVNIKIDREERPDIDQIYMDAVQAMGIHGGWPLNVFLTPESKPFYGGTYFPPDHWKNILEQIHQAFINHRSEIEQSADNFSRTLIKTEVEKYNLTSTDPLFLPNDLKIMVERMAPSFDLKMGGTSRAPKFPMPSIYQFLLTQGLIREDEGSLRHVYRTLDKMSYGGIYDQIGGGFCRYSTDMDWFAPHFEKMLYDNGQLISLYSKAYQFSQDENYKVIVQETINWLKNEMLSAEGAFYSALDADSEGVEGKFYCWSYEELEKLLADDFLLVSDYYQLKPQGNWEHHFNILFKVLSDEAFAKKHKLPVGDLKLKVHQWKTLLLKERGKRIRPGLDDKILASWNGMALKGLADAYAVFQEPVYLELAIQNANFILNKLSTPQGLFRSYKNGKTSILGFLEDYAFVIEGLIALYQATFDVHWLNEACKLTKHVMGQFFDTNEELFYFTAHDAEKLITRKKEIFDNVIPASNSVMASNLFYLGHYFYEDNWLDLSKSMVAKIKKMLLIEPSYLTNWAVLYASLIVEPIEVAILGKDYKSLCQQIKKLNINSIIITGAENSSELPLLKGKKSEPHLNSIYICSNRVCQAPVHSIEQAISIINDLYKTSGTRIQ